MWTYITSIIAYYVILKSSIKIGKIFLENNGRLDKIHKINEKNKTERPSELVVALIPVFRLIAVLSIYYICFCSDEQFNKIIKDIEIKY